MLSLLSQFNAQKVKVVFVDPSIQDYENLLNGLKTGFRAFMLNANEDGIEQITSILSWLKSECGLEEDGFSIHIFAHSTSKGIRLGSAELSLATLNDYAEQIKVWFPQLENSNPDSRFSLFFYGCYLALEDSGEALMQALHQLTKANVATSTVQVGAPPQDEDWRLDQFLFHYSVLKLPFASQNFASQCA